MNNKRQSYHLLLWFTIPFKSMNIYRGFEVCKVLKEYKIDNGLYKEYSHKTKEKGITDFNIVGPDKVFQQEHDTVLASSK